MTVRCGFAQLLRGPGVGGTAGHVEMDDLPRAVDHEKEREDGTEKDVVELQKVARPNVTTVVSGESDPSLAAFTRRPYIPHVFLNG